MPKGWAAAAALSGSGSLTAGPGAFRPAAALSETGILSAAATVTAAAAVISSSEPALPRRIVRRDRQIGISLLAAATLVWVVYVVIKVSLAEAGLPPEKLAEANELTTNLGLLLSTLLSAAGLCLGLRPPRK